MPLPIYMAMTGTEFKACPVLPKYCSWMACHFSAYGSGLTNIPKNLPPDSLLMINDWTPPQSHDPAYIANQLKSCWENFQMKGVILDFQRPYQRETAEIAQLIQHILPCPVVITPIYRENWDGGLILPPIPPHCRVKDYLSEYGNRPLWLELSSDGVKLQLTESGCTEYRIPYIEDPLPFRDESLHCHYRLKTEHNHANILLQRTSQDQKSLLEEAEKSGIELAVILYQEACSICPSQDIDFVRPHDKEAGYGKHLS